MWPKKNRKKHYKFRQKRSPLGGALCARLEVRAPLTKKYGKKKEKEKAQFNPLLKGLSPPLPPIPPAHSSLRRERCPHHPPPGLRQTTLGNRQTTSPTWDPSPPTPPISRARSWGSGNGAERGLSVPPQNQHRSSVYLRIL